MTFTTSFAHSQQKIKLPLLYGDARDYTCPDAHLSQADKRWLNLGRRRDSAQTSRAKAGQIVEALKPPPFEYFAPTEINEAIDLLAGSDNARVLAGGQSLMAMLNMRYVFPDRIIDLNRIPALDFTVQSADELVIGAMARQRSLQRSLLVASHLPVMQKALRHVGHFQTRNRGTIGGSLCQLDPSAELPAVAMAYDAVVEAQGPNGKRSIPFKEFPIMFMTSSLAQNEILTAVRFKPWAGTTGSGFSEFSRRHGDFAVAGAVALLQSGTDNRISRASVTLFGIAETPRGAGDVEAMLVGQHATADLIDAASRLCAAHATLADNYGSAEYRGEVAAAMAKNAITEAYRELRAKVP
jgi:carbon-monoxide dehydrogenase medium subunit